MICFILLRGSKNVTQTHRRNQKMRTTLPYVALGLTCLVHYRKYLLLHFFFKQTLLLPSSAVSPTQQKSQVSILQYRHFHDIVLQQHTTLFPFDWYCDPVPIGDCGDSLSGLNCSLHTDVFNFFFLADFKNSFLTVLKKFTELSFLDIFSATKSSSVK